MKIANDQNENPDKIETVRRCRLYRRQLARIGGIERGCVAIKPISLPNDQPVV